MSRLFQILKLYFLFLLTFEIGRLYFVIYTIPVNPDSAINLFFLSAWKGFRLDLSASAYCVVPILIVYFSEYAFRKQFHPILLRSILGIEFVFIFMITVADPELFLQWGNKFNNQVLVYISHPKEMALSSGAVNWIKTGIFSVISLVVFLFIYAITSKIALKKLTFSWQYFMVLMLSSVLTFIAMRGGVGVSTISQASAIFSKHAVHNAAAVNSLWNGVYYIVNDTRTLYGDSYKFIDEEQAGILFKNQLNVQDSGLKLTEIEKPNILVIMLESFTASGSRYFSGANNCMPYLDKIAAENLSFMHCYSSGDRTEKGLVCINSGYPAQTVSSIIIFPDKVSKLPGISKVLKLQKYTNTFIYGGDAEFASMKSYLTMQEFDRVIDKRDFESVSLTSKWGAHDAELYAKTMETLEHTAQPFYQLCLTLSSHEPFEVPYSSPDLPKDNWYPYKNSLRYADKALYDFLEACKKKAWYKNTLIFLVADHGHEIGLPDTYFFGREKFHIPLVVCGGALKNEYKNTKIQQVVSQTILPSLVMQSMGLPVHDFKWQTSELDSNGFAQYHFNNGFGRITNHSECVYDNSGVSYFFKGRDFEHDSLREKGKVFQQVLISDFLKK